MITEVEVFEAVRRGYLEFETASNTEILDYFSAIDEGFVAGHASHIKGILFEQEYVDLLAVQGVESQIFEATNHPITDIAVFDGGDIANELQLKATDSVSYLSAAVQENPDVGFVVTSEVATGVDSDMVMDSGIEDAVLEQAVSDTLLDEVINPFSPFSGVGLLFGLPF
jgi:hypothetical protein